MLHMLVCHCHFHCCSVVPLIDKGAEIEVTNQNKMQYLNLLAQPPAGKVSQGRGGALPQR